jgi:hypothetical protein
MKPLDQQTLSRVKEKESVDDFEAALLLAISSDDQVIARAIADSSEIDEHQAN